MNAHEAGEKKPFTEGERPWLLHLICCGTNAGLMEFATWDEADTFRQQYERPSGHDRVAIIREATDAG